METKKVYTVIGLMSGTSLDGVDAALLETDGHSYIKRLDFVSIPYAPETQETIRKCLGLREDLDGFIARAEIEITRSHAAAIDWLLSKTGRHPQDIDLIGFHGQTIFHDPANRFTWQIGSGPMLARLTGIAVVNDFRSADVAAGGQGAPLIPLYHKALVEAASLTKPVAVLNIGGVGNITFIGSDDTVLAFDTGPGNALLNDWVKTHTGAEYDEDGKLARQGRVDEVVLDKLLSHPYFTKAPPKSLDRDAWDISILQSLSAADGAATLTAFTVKSIALARAHLPEMPLHWYVTGGGRHNLFMMDGLRGAFNVPVDSVDTLGWDGDALEAEGFGYLAVRALLKLPLSLPTTTGVPEPLTGGRFYKAGQ